MILDLPDGHRSSIYPFFCLLPALPLSTLHFLFTRSLDVLSDEEHYYILVV